MNNPYQEKYQEEQSRSNTWMIIAIIAILIGLVLLTVVGYLVWTRNEKPKCDCIISQQDIQNVQGAAEMLKMFKGKLSTLGTLQTDCSPLAIKSACAAANEALAKAIPKVAVAPALKAPSAPLPKSANLGMPAFQPAPPCVGEQCP
jgi:hypothetical protein